MHRESTEHVVFQSGEALGDFMCLFLLVQQRLTEHKDHRTLLLLQMDLIDASGPRGSI